MASSTPSAGSKVAGITELLENILIHLPARDFFLYQRVSPKFKAIIVRQLAKSPIQVPLNCTPHLERNKLPVVPGLLDSSTIYRIGLTLPGTHDRWHVCLNLDRDHLRSIEPGGDESWRKLFVCRNTTKQIEATVWTRRSRWATWGQADIPRVQADFPRDRKAGRDMSITFTSQDAITLGNIVGWACALQDRLRASAESRTVFRAVVDLDGLDRLDGWSSHDTWLYRQRESERAAGDGAEAHWMLRVKLQKKCPTVGELAEGQSWRRLPVCKDTTRVIQESLEYVDDDGQRNSKSKLFSSSTAITLGQIADWTYKMGPRPVEAGHQVSYDIEFGGNVEDSGQFLWRENQIQSHPNCDLSETCGYSSGGSEASF